VRNHVAPNQIAVRAAARHRRAAVSTAQETMIPLSAVTRYDSDRRPLDVNLSGLFVASTISFNLVRARR